jgi:hypothetical protein
VVALIMFGERAVALGMPGYDPSLTRELAFASTNRYIVPGAWFAAAAGITLAIAVLYELPHRIFRRGTPFAAVLAMLAGLVTSSGEPMAVSAAATVLCVAVLMAVYAIRGFAALFTTVIVAALLVDLVTARSVGGAIAGTRGAALAVALVALAGYATWSSLALRGTSKTEDGRSKISSKLGI